MVSSISNKLFMTRQFTKIDLLRKETNDKSSNRISATKLKMMSRMNLLLY